MVKFEFYKNQYCFLWAWNIILLKLSSFWGRGVGFQAHRSVHSADLRPDGRLAADYTRGNPSEDILLMQSNEIGGCSTEMAGMFDDKVSVSFRAGVMLLGLPNIVYGWGLASISLASRA